MSDRVDKPDGESTRPPPWPERFSAAYFRALADLKLDTETFRKLYLCEFPPDPPLLFWFFAPSFRVAVSMLRVDFDIEPRLPCIRIVTERVDSLRGLKRGSIVTKLDPDIQLRSEIRAEFRAIHEYRGWREWNEADRRLLVHLTNS